jgi:hypothetical protein
MNLFLHILIHISLSFLAGFVVWRALKEGITGYFQVFLVFFSALVLGVAVDFDHFIDYFLAFGFSFNSDYFISGYQFLKSDRLYVLLHAWEYVVILAILAFLIKNKLAKAMFFSLALGLFFHLSADVLIDNVPARTYSIIFRVKNNFELEKIVTPEH